MLLFDASHTSHTRARTGIQRVCRSLNAALAATDPVTAVCFDPHEAGWRPLNRAERATLAGQTEAPAGGSRGAKWSLAQKIAGHARRLTGRRAVLPGAGGLLCPELFSHRVAAHLPDIFARVSGPRVAIFHDALGLQFPELTPPTTVARLPAYLHELRQFDGVAAVSEDSAECLRSYWRWLGAGPTPPVQAIPLGLDEISGQAAGAAEEAGPPRVLCVGTIEGRKNHLALLDAAESLWCEGVPFALELIGLARPDTAAPALGKITALRRMGRPLTYHGSVSERALLTAYARCTFTVYPSFAEGFGLPVLESLRAGKPCVCSARGALGESARGGGCLTMESVDSASLAAALRQLLRNPSTLTALAAAARQRKFRSWHDYAADLKSWMAGLRPRSG